MSSGKSHFEVHDVGESTEGKQDPKKYTGLERRRENRRGGKERRQEVRFEIDKEDRRKDHGRRHDDNAPHFW